MNVAFHSPRRFSALMLLLIVAAVVSCESTPKKPVERPPVPRVSQEPILPPSQQPGPAVTEIGAEPDIRIRILASVDTVTLDSETGLLSLGPSDPSAPASIRQTFATPITVRRDAQGYLIDAADRDVRWNLDALAVTSSQPIMLDGQRYPGTLVIMSPHQATYQLDVIEYLPMEQYLPGVIAKELFGDWHPETFKAQAIAARSYAMYQRKLRAGQHFDLEDTTASQVYDGITTNSTALNATRDTRGMVLTYQGYVVPAFFSADAGLRGQNAADAFPGFPDMLPLRGSDYRKLPSVSPHEAWGPVTRFGPNLSQRLRSWGAARGNALAQLDQIRDLDIIAVSPLSRPRMVRIVDVDGQVFDVAAESFRLAANRAVPGLPKLPPTGRLKSSDFEVAVRENGRSITFRGTGFGHGVGLSQWHAQTLANTGTRYRDILAIFYPGATIEALY